VRVVLDTNVIVSRHISPRGAPARIYGYWQQRRFDVLVTTDILNEYADVFSRPSIQRRTGIPVGEVGIVIAEISHLAVAVIPERMAVGVSADPDDDMFLECALAGSADYIVTGDQHLLVLKTFHDIPIVSPALFAAILEHDVKP
jgi:uncharacterized protein